MSATLALMTRVAPAETAWRAKLRELIELQNTLNAEATSSAEQTQSSARVVGGLLVLLAIGLGALIAWRITASITAPIGRAVVVAERIARGDLTSQVEVRIHDETGRLLEAIAAMQERLRTLVGEIGQTDFGQKVFQSIALKLKAVQSGPESKVFQCGKPDIRSGFVS